ncbi:uncharacterized protein LOC105218808 isoform X2 [Zeugodacus cucurbitae]|uniref:uncharacterized protein LOC105218808 isoform X2 n=1 Tax=Zeugodacus cucurbitae TaxID=28588 RepID=UPI0023D8F0FF|nr:uncharacterized protein LOC105218808 isoform X2 [Zeugodacus cucurbitae]
MLPEETLKTQRVEVYLNDLKERLKELRVQHDEVIQNSVDIIKEIDEVSSGLLLPQNSGVDCNDNVTKIKKLIKEFESARESNSAKIPVSIESKVDIRKILQNFEKLNESHVLKESLVLFKRAKESLEKIDTFLGTHLENVIIQSVNASKGNLNPPISSTTTKVVEFHNDCEQSPTLPQFSSDTINNIVINDNNKITDCTLKSTNSGSSPATLATVKSQISTNSNSSLKHRINMFSNEKSGKINSCDSGKNITPSCYASCCSSVTSMDVYESAENVCIPNMCGNESSCVNSLEMGYEGDNDDSEYDLFALKRKKNKVSSANQQ